MAMPDKVETRPLLVAAVKRLELQVAAMRAYEPRAATPADLAQPLEQLAAARTLLALAETQWEAEERAAPEPPAP